MPAVEVVLRAGADSPLDAILRRTDAQIYHVCYEVDDFEDALRRLRSDGHRPLCVVPRTPAVLFGGRLVSFHYVGGFGLVELLEP
jgi:methylmalonyl-CoA/ethylmalonyl-CoA epimerase